MDPAGKLFEPVTSHLEPVANSTSSTTTDYSKCGRSGGNDLRSKDQGDRMAKAERDWHEYFLQVWMALGCHQDLDLLEVCAPWDSPLAASVASLGGKVMRLGIHNGFDLSTTKGYHMAAEVIKTKKPRYVHCSPPCYAHSVVQNGNQRNTEQVNNLVQKQKHASQNSEKMALGAFGGMGGQMVSFGGGGPKECGGSGI